MILVWRAVNALRRFNFHLYQSNVQSNIASFMIRRLGKYFNLRVL
jgi:hypothetical protein